MARQTQLVSQQLENIFHEALSKYPDVIRSYVRGRQGIYALYRKDELGHRAFYIAGSKATESKSGGKGWPRTRSLFQRIYEITGDL